MAERVRNVHLSSFFTARQEAEEAFAEEITDMLGSMGFAFGEEDDDFEDESDSQHDPYGYRYGGGSWADDDCGA